MSQSLSTVLNNMIDEFMGDRNNVVGSTSEHTSDLSNPSVASTTNRNDTPTIRERFTTPVDVRVAPIPVQNDGIQPLNLHNGPVFHTMYLMKANFKRLSLADIVKEAIDGILREGDKEGPQREINQMHARQLAQRLQNVRHHANNAKDIYDIHPDIGDTCIYLYTLETFWYRSINSTLRALPAITDEQFQTFAPFCYLLQTYLKKTPAVEDNVPSIVYRGVRLTDEQIEQYKQTNNCFQFTSFTSTSKNRTKAEEFGNALFIINLNVLDYRGEEVIRVGAYIAQHSRFPPEEEFLLWPLTILRFEKYEFDAVKKKHLIYLTSAVHPDLAARNRR